MLVAGEAAVEHGSAGKAAAPGVGVAGDAPGVEAEALLHVAPFVCNGGPAAEVVLENVVQRGVPSRLLVKVVGAAPLVNGEHAQGADQVGQAASPVRAVVILATAHMEFGTVKIVNYLFHQGHRLIILTVSISHRSVFPPHVFCLT